MSRVFDNAQVAPNETTIITPSSAAYNQKSKVTLAMWVYATALGAYDVLCVKDPAGQYTNTLALISGALTAGIGGNSPATSGKINSLQIIAGGLLYAINDLGTIDGGVGSPQEYKVFGVGAGGVCNDVGTNSPIQGTYNLNQTYATTPSSGTGNAALTLKVTSVTPSTVNSTATSNETIPLNTWTHVAATCDLAGDKVVHLYINGVECTYASQSSGGQAVDDSGDGYWMGNDGFDEGFTGRIAEFTVYNSVLTAGQIAALAGSTTGATGAPSGYWHLCGTASPEPDSSGNGNSGVLSTPAPAKGADSPGYNCSGPPPPPATPDNLVIDSLSRCCSRVLP